MITSKLIKQADDYLERHCVDKKWFARRAKAGHPVDPHRIESLKNVIAQLEGDEGRTPRNDAAIAAHIKNLQENPMFSTQLGSDPLPITKEERAKARENHRSCFANYFFALMEQKNFREEELTAKARADVAFFSRLREDKKYVPAERTVWAFLLALELNLSQANSLMQRLKYYLSANVMEETLIAFFLDNQIYDLPLADEVLEYYGFESLEIREDFTQRPPEKTFKDEALLERIDAYIEKNFFDLTGMEELQRRGFHLSYRVKSFGEPAESIKTFEAIIRALKDKIGLAGTYFSDYLFKLIKQKNLTEVDVYKRANLDRRIFSKIRHEKGYMPSKKTVLAMVFAMKLDFKEANTLLARAGYSLSGARKEDVIAAFFLENQIYDLFLINEVLDYYDCPILGG